MISHTSLGDKAFKRNRQLKILLNKKLVTFAGNIKLKIYGTLDCSSGKRMKVQNRIFFITEDEAIALGYRPCGHCMLAAYKQWRASNLVNS
jgi:methylphosphotriester-DNA--protein-cysteine methyltransferase